jgi:glycosyltransferase involved in cell wall biosynthesis
MLMSLVTCTKNRAHALPAFLGALERLGIDGTDSEFLLVDNGSSDGTMDLFREWSAGRVGFRALREESPGVSVARNTGWRAAGGGIIVMIDDDCYPNPDLLEAWRRVFDEDPSIGWGSGRVLLHDPGDDPVAIDEREQRLVHRAGTYLPCGEVQGSNQAYRREVLERIGGFDPRTGVGTPFGCEDIDTAARASYAGWNGVFDPRPVVRHHHGRKNGEGYLRLRTVYADGEGAYYAKCLLDPAMRKDYLRPFVGRLRHRPWNYRLRILRAAFAWCRSTLVRRR